MTAGRVVVAGIGVVEIPPRDQTLKAAARGFVAAHTDACMPWLVEQLRRTLEVRDDAGTRLAFGDQLRRTADRPMTRLRRHGDRITREDLWPDDGDIGRPVILPGGEVGILQS